MKSTTYTAGAALLLGTSFGLLSSAGFGFHSGSPGNANAPKSAAASNRAAGHNKFVGLTFNQDIAPIIYANCSQCHHAGQVAPFPLMNYRDVKDHAAIIETVVDQKFMPPWHAVSHGEFLGERKLSSIDIQKIHDWVEAGAEEGDSPAPTAPTYSSGWAIGNPDAVLKVNQPYHLAADGDDVYRCFVVKNPYTTDRWVSAVEVHPGNHRVVHHVIVYLDASGQAKDLDGKDGQPGYTCFGGPGFLPSGSLGGWAPGLEREHFSGTDAMLLPPGGDIVIQVHYHKDGKPETDQTSVGLKFAPDGPHKRVRVGALIHFQLAIPPNDNHYEVQSQLTLPANVRLLAVIPHMHVLGKKMVVTASEPSGKTQQLIDVEPWDFNWQMFYFYKQPLHLARGTKIKMVADYDNSTANPRNPNNPPKMVHWGEQTTDEMCIAFFFYTVDSPLAAQLMKPFEAF